VPTISVGVAEYELVVQGPCRRRADIPHRTVPGKSGTSRICGAAGDVQQCAGDSGYRCKGALAGELAFEFGSFGAVGVLRMVGS